MNFSQIRAKLDEPFEGTIPELRPFEPEPLLSKDDLVAFDREILAAIVKQDTA